MNIHIKTIPHKEQRYRTCGDWVYDEAGDLKIYVSDLGNWKYEFLIGLHELVEVLVCKEMGVTQEQVDRFDYDFEIGIANGLHKIEDEPGDDPDAPYRLAHFIATTAEMIVATALGVDWRKYEDSVLSLDRKA